MNRPALRVALRAAVAVSVGFSLGRYVFDEPQFAVFASFTSLTLVAYADFGGPMPMRLRAIGVTIALGLVLVTLGTLTSESGWGGPLLVGVVGFAVAYSAVLGGYFVAGATSVILFVVLAAAIPAPDDALAWRLGGTAVGGALAVAVTVLMWPSRPERDFAPSLRRAAESLGRCLAPEGDREAALESATAEVRGLRSRLGGSGVRPTEPTARHRAALRLVFDLDRLLGRISRTIRRPAPPPPATQPLLGRSSAALAAAAAALEPSPMTEDPVALSAQVRALIPAARAEVADRAGREGAGTVAREVEDVAIAGEIAQAACRAALDAEVAAGGRPRTDDPAVAGLLTQGTVEVARRRLRLNLTPRSVHLRNAARLAVALTLAMALVRIFDLQHGFWVVLATLTVVGSAAVSTGATARQVLLGTGVGFALAMVVVLGADGDSHVYVGLLGLVVCGAVYASRAEGIVAGQAGFTVLVVVLFGLLEPAGWTLALSRVEDVTIGAAVGVGIAMLAWPAGAGGRLPAAVADVLERAVDEVRAAARQVFGAPASGPPPTELRLATLHAAQRAEDDLAVALAERRPGTGPERVWPGLLGDAGSLWYSTFWVATLPPGAGAAGADGPGSLAQSLAARADAATVGYLAVAAALRAGHPPPEPPPVVPDDDAVARCIAATPAGAAARGDLVDLLTARSWVRELEAGLVRVTERLQAAGAPA